jgi:hypothetical protein
MPADERKRPQEPKLPGDLPDLPPLPSRFYRPRPKTSCPHCGKRFGTVEELNEHARRAHPAEMDAGE